MIFKSMTGDDIENLEWFLRAECSGKNSRYFYRPLDRVETKDERYLRVRIAKFICSGCAVITECRDYAERLNEQIGIWGGETEDERMIRTKLGDTILSASDEEFKI